MKKGPLVTSNDLYGLTSFYKKICISIMLAFTFFVSKSMKNHKPFSQNQKSTFNDLCVYIM